MESKKPVLYLMLGYPGAGKTTTSKVIHELTGAVHLWADHERRKRFPRPTHNHAENLALYNELNQITEQLLGEGKSVIFDTNFNFYKDRQYMRRIATKQGAEVKLLWVTTPKQLAKQRATHISHAQRNTYDEAMPEHDFDRMAGNLQPPRAEEQAIEIDGTKVTPTYIQELLGL